MKDENELITDLTQNYQKQLQLYKKLLKYTKKQYKNILNDDLENLDQINKQKEEIIKSIKDLQQNIYPSREKLAIKFKIENNEEFIYSLLQKNIIGKEKLKKIGKRLIKTINEVKETTQKLKELIKEKNDNLQSEIEQLSNGKKLFDSYNTSNNSTATEGKFIDDKS